MKRCPVCNNRFDDPYLSFCPNDGTPLLRVTSEEAAATVLMPQAGQTSPRPETNLPPPPQPYGWANDPPAQWTPPPPPAIRGPATQQQTLAAASLILGILSITIGWLCGGPFLALFAVVLGIVALMQIRKSPLHHGGKPMALIGLILGGIVLVIYVVIMAIWLIMLMVGAVTS
ncbi:MAG TPA: DUF4190 domain-containing protein [Pyrinomonadaceae bacterium]|nr:DUF4190 domain-containing protein [Pyrinomonadaceae bacterium]